MRILACNADTLDLQLPECPAVPDPIPAGAYSAYLSRSNCPLKTLVFEVITLLGAPPVVRITLPAATDALKRGVWTLSVKTPCGCYSTPVYIDRCVQPLLPSTHTPTRDLPSPIPAHCVPDLQPDLGEANPVLGFVFARSVDGDWTGADSAPEIGSQLAPFPTLTSFELGADSDALQLEGVLNASGIGALAGQAWTLFDAAGLEVALGTLVAADANGVTLAGDTLDFLSCGPHYLVITTSPET